MCRKEGLDMAGINFEKYHSATEAKAILRHCDKEQRTKTGQHSNEHINKSATRDNFQLSIKGFSGSYKGVCDNYDNRIREIDKKAVKTPRKDRVTLVGMELPRPKDLPPEQFRKWSVDAVTAIREYYRKQGLNDGLLAVYGHVDEVHEYKRFDENLQGTVTDISREHIHAFFTPYSPDGSSLNAKEFTKRSNMIGLNKAVNDMSLKKYGVSFNDGSKRKSKKSMEELKSASRTLEQEENERLQAENARLRALNEQLQEKVRVLQEKAVNKPVRTSEGYQKPAMRELPDMPWLNTSADDDYSL